MTLVYIVKLELITWMTSVEAQKTDGLLLEIYDMTLAKFLLQDNLEKVWFFKRIFLLPNTNIEIVLGILFLSLSNADINFEARLSRKLT